VTGGFNPYPGQVLDVPYHVSTLRGSNQSSEALLLAQSLDWVYVKPFGSSFRRLLGCEVGNDPRFLGGTVRIARASLRVRTGGEPSFIHFPTPYKLHPFNTLAPSISFFLFFLKRKYKKDTTSVLDLYHILMNLVKSTS